jgi:hypothetical protein
MIKFIISSLSIYEKIIKNKYLARQVSFDLDNINEIKSEDTFFEAIRQVRLPNGTFKTTINNRFHDLDKEFLPLLNVEKTYSIHDIGTSDGITAVNLIDGLDIKDISYDFSISDKFSDIYLYKKGLLKYFINAEDNILFADLGGIMFNQYLSNRFFLSKFLGKFLPQKAHNNIENKKTVLLINPRTKDCINKNKLNFFNYDLFNPSSNPGTFDIVRCMNLLNPRLFSEDLLRKGIKNIFESVKNDGLMVIGRTNPRTGENYATVYQKSDEKLKPILKVNGGNEIDALMSQVVNINE